MGIRQTEIGNTKSESSGDTFDIFSHATPAKPTQQQGATASHAADGDKA